MNVNATPSRIVPCAVAVAGLFMAGCREKQPTFRELYYGIPVRVEFSPYNDSLAREVWEYLEGVDDVFNGYRADSEIGRLNAALGGDDHAEERSVSPDLAEALRLSVEAHGVSEGAFDITVRPLINLWRAAEKTKLPPDDAEIAATLARCGFDKVLFEDGGADGGAEGGRLSTTVRGVSLDFGGIVKGIAVDRAVAMLQGGGATSGIVQVGGETACWGISKRGRSHIVGVRHPLAPLDASALWTAVADQGDGLSCATSGNYFSPIVIGGKPYYHILDPRTGRPVDTRTLSVTVAFPRTGRNGLADALSTAGAVLGPERAVALAQQLGAEALVVYVESNADDAADAEPLEAKTPGWDALVPR
jgi:thiamine biosynthesis lipoprotein